MEMKWFAIMVIGLFAAWAVTSVFKLHSNQEIIKACYEAAAKNPKIVCDKI